MRSSLLILMLACCSALAQTVTQLHSYGDADPELVERQIRALVPEGPRVSMNRRAGQVIVVASPDIQEKVAAMVAQLSRKPLELRFRIRLNREVREFTVRDGVPFSVPVTEQPPEALLQMARGRLDPDKKNLPAVATALQFHAILLREDPVMVRLRVTPAVVFGVRMPYEVVSFEEVTQDMLVVTESFLNVSQKLSSHDFYRNFLRTRSEPSASATPVGILLSLETAPAGSEE